jgi:lycopene beta-cyclase
MRVPDHPALILAGGGLANGLIAWRLRQVRPQVRVLIVESGASLGGNHTWSFHDSDLTAAQRDWIKPLVAHRWPHHTVLFTKRRRQVNSGYASISAAQFHAVLARSLQAGVLLNMPITYLHPTAVQLASGQTLRAAAVIDGRGFVPSPHLSLRYQKFVGQELRLHHPHRLSGPVLMDACVPQHDGYRFVYVLPLTARTVLVEDTYFADGAQLDAPVLRQRIRDYAFAQGWMVDAVLREEQGVLPITLDGDIHAYWRALRGQPVSGLRAALCHPATGYSLPSAVRLADMIAQLPDLSAPALASAIEDHAVAAWRSQAFFRALNRMLFLAARPALRHQVMAHFYRLPDEVIARFYAGQLLPRDKLRILTGRPPVPVHQALRALAGA